MKNSNINLFFITISPWPLILSISLIIFCINLIQCLFIKFNLTLFLSFLSIILILYCWWIDIVIESLIIGFHNIYIVSITIYRIIIFIISEILFFIRFFWTFFNSIISPDISIGLNWPPYEINVINFLNLPLLNSLLLIRSACSLTWRHYKILRNNLKSSKLSLIITKFLGLNFLLCQIFEYYTSIFSISDGIFCSIFFISTGFHGIHVLIGLIFLFFMFIRIKLNHFSKDHFIGFEFSIWYWHFVDIVWLFLYLIIYWLGS